MASLNNTRMSAMLAKENLTALDALVHPLAVQVDTWVINGIDDDLPSEGEVKTVLEAYNLLKIPRNSSDTALRDVLASTETFDGIFAVTPGTFPRIFDFAGPVWAPLEQSQGFGVALTIERITVYVGKTGTAGADLSVDVQIDGVTVLSAVPAVPIGSGEKVFVLVPSSNIITNTIPANGILSAHIVTAPNDAESVSVSVWLKP